MNRAFGYSMLAFIFAVTMTACGGSGGGGSSSYTVGGLVSGLSGTMVLQNNSGEILP